MVVIFTKRQMAGVIIVMVLGQGAIGLIKIAAARHSTHDGVDGTVARAAQVVF